ncbi:MAG: hypothetical protein FWC39_05685 [Bacteroidetes bacterium]|nr:hypothetical protein [Bacteroidota bacterium]
MNRSTKYELSGAKTITVLVMAFFIAAVSVSAQDCPVPAPIVTDRII